MWIQDRWSCWCRWFDWMTGSWSGMVDVWGMSYCSGIPSTVTGCRRNCSEAPTNTETGDLHAALVDDWMSSRMQTGSAQRSTGSGHCCKWMAGQMGTVLQWEDLRTGSVRPMGILTGWLGTALGKKQSETPVSLSCGCMSGSASYWNFSGGFGTRMERSHLLQNSLLELHFYFETEILSPDFDLSVLNAVSSLD